MPALRVEAVLFYLTVVRASHYPGISTDQYDLSSTITSVVTLDGTIQTTGTVAFLVDGDFRGYSSTVNAIPAVFPYGANGYYEFSGQVFGDAADTGKSLSFVYHPDGSGVEYSCTQTNSAIDTSSLTLNSNYGTLQAPLVLTAADAGSSASASAIWRGAGPSPLISGGTSHGL